MPERVQKILSQWGIASRREAERLIAAGRVQLNGQVVQLGTKADLDRDRLTVDGQDIAPADRPAPLYLLLNKPRGTVSTCRDPQGRPTVLDLLPPHYQQHQGIHPVGRLDADSTGALLLTNDGELTLALTHPRYHLPKTYHVWVAGQPSASALQQWRSGLVLAGRRTLPAQIEVLTQRADKTLLEVILVEGRNRQIRRVAAKLGYPVLQLHRLAIGTLTLTTLAGSSLPSGQYRALTAVELHHCLGIDWRKPVQTCL
ncbi:MAG: rRNA pseudouridine synthase [Spirulinaceae cyanobacterium RM2_2_10]|nr:rRNA pseudouridine synthase [Spirulinaceae cyanobacterium SM2_1_0]NJO19657.1 rRNA pseudouridine synthase [Spirulinaceae cyanobacterium RM2_2_10]